jgi:hypothetical protein
MFLAESVPRVGTLLTTDDGAQLLIEEASDRAVTLVRILPPKSGPTEAAPS